MKIGIIVEGISDKRTIKTLAERILSSPVGIEIRQLPKGDLLKPDKVSSFIKYDLGRDPDISKIIICVDLEDINENEVKQAENRLANIGPRVRVRYKIIVHALESWLLADAKALSQYLNTPSINISPSATNDPNPKRILSEIFRKAGKEFNHVRDDPRIAELVDLNQMNSNPSFAKFQKNLKNIRK